MCHSERKKDLKNVLEKKKVKKNEKKNKLKKIKSAPDFKVDSIEVKTMLKKKNKQKTNQIVNSAKTIKKDH